jgi:hypothetical protein
VFAFEKTEKVHLSTGLSALLAQLHLSRYAEKLLQVGCELVEDVETLTEEELINDAGLKKPHARRLIKHFSQLAATHAPVTRTHKPAAKDNSEVSDAKNYASSESASPSESSSSQSSPSQSIKLTLMSSSTDTPSESPQPQRLSPHSHSLFQAAAGAEAARQRAEQKLSKVMWLRAQEAAARLLAEEEEAERQCASEKAEVSRLLAAEERYRAEKKEAERLLVEKESALLHAEAEVAAERLSAKKEKEATTESSSEDSCNRFVMLL